MTDKPWKAFEREVGELIGGKRHWANSGESVDCESERFVVQCKHVKSMSLSALTKLAMQAEADGAIRNKYGGVAVKLRDGRGRWTPTLMVMTDHQFSKLLKDAGMALGLEGE